MLSILLKINGLYLGDSYYFYDYYLCTWYILRKLFVYISAKNKINFKMVVYMDDILRLKNKAKDIIDFLSNDEFLYIYNIMLTLSEFPTLELEDYINDDKVLESFRLFDKKLEDSKHKKIVESDDVIAERYKEKLINCLKFYDKYVDEKYSKLDSGKLHKVITPMGHIIYK